MTDAPELKPCPFCGARGRMSREFDPDGFGVFLFIECVACRARSRQKYHSDGNDCPQTYQEVRDEWNTRYDLHQQALDKVREEGRRAGLEEAAKMLLDRWLAALAQKD